MAKKAFDQVWKSITGTPGATLTRHRFVNYNSDGDVVTVAASGGNAVGVAYEANAVGEPAQVVAAGFAFIELGATVAAGTRVMSDASGRAIAYAEATDPATNVPLGTLAVGGVLGDIGTILLGH